MKRPTLDPPLSFSESRAFHGNLRGGAILLSGLEPDPNDDSDEASFFARALADLNVRDSGALLDSERSSAERLSYPFPSTSGHAYPPRGLGESHRNKERESIDRTDHELFAERATWQREEAGKGRNRSGLNDIRHS